MDSHGSCFGPSTTSARVGAGDGVDLAAGGSCASVSGALGLLHSACHDFGCIARHGVPGKPRLRRCGSIAPSGDGAWASPPNSSFKPNWLRQSA